MGELAEDFRFMKEQARKHRERIEPSRFAYVEKSLRTIGCTIDGGNYYEIYFTKGNISGKIYPYKGWWSAKGIGSGRGIKKLVKALEGIKGVQNDKRI